MPFILGAIRDPLGKAPHSRTQGNIELLELLKRMKREAPNDCGAFIRPCNTAGHVVIPEGNRFDWDPYDFEGATTVDALSAQLWKRYGDNISAGHYSIEHSKWRQFRDWEVTEIRRVLDLGAN